MKSLLKLVIFAFDGTLIDTFSMYVDIATQLSIEFSGKDIDETIIEIFRTQGVKKAITQIGIPFYKLPSYIKTFKKRIAEKLHDYSLFPGITKTIENVSKKADIGIITYNDSENVKNYLKMKNITCFDFVYTADYNKKNLEIDRLFFEKNTAKNKTLYIGDQFEDIISAKKSLIKSCAVTWGFNSKVRLEEAKPDYICEKPLDILEIDFFKN